MTAPLETFSWWVDLLDGWGTLTKPGSANLAALLATATCGNPPPPLREPVCWALLAKTPWGVLRDRSLWTRSALRTGLFASLLLTPIAHARTRMRWPSPQTWTTGPETLDALAVECISSVINVSRAASHGTAGFKSFWVH